MKTRVITGVVLVALISAVIWLGGWWLRGVALLLMLLSMHEMYAAYRHKGLRPVPVGLALAPLLLPCALFMPGGRMMEAALMLLALLAAVGVGAIVLRGNVDGARLQATLLPLVYPGVFYILLFDLTNVGAGMPLTLLFVLLFLVPSMNDCFALFTGMACGKRKLSPQISPKKTVEGFVGGLLLAIGGAVLAAWIYRYFWLENVTMHYLLVLLLAAICAPLSVLGDLFASIIKRQNGAKDYGHLFPGHGGVMDRFDSLIFVAPVTYLFIQAFPLIR